MKEDEHDVLYVLTIIQGTQVLFFWLLIFASCVNSESMARLGKLNY